MNEMQWWTPDGGFRDGEEPERFAAIENLDDYGMLADAGYEQRAFGSERPNYNIEVYTHQDHSIVVLNEPNLGWVTRFGVDRTHVNAFYLEKLPALLSAFALVDSAAAQSRITKTLIAFVRHGQSENTIDEFGSETADDVRERRRAERVAATATSKKGIS